MEATDYIGLTLVSGFSINQTVYLFSKSIREYDDSSSSNYIGYKDSVNGQTISNITLTQLPKFGLKLKIYVETDSNGDDTYIDAVANTSYSFDKFLKTKIDFSGVSNWEQMTLQKNQI